jgi:hypothetical protein
MTEKKFKAWLPGRIRQLYNETLTRGARGRGTTAGTFMEQALLAAKVGLALRKSGTLRATRIVTGDIGAVFYVDTDDGGAIRVTHKGDKGIAFCNAEDGGVGLNLKRSFPDDGYPLHMDVLAVVEAAAGWAKTTEGDLK